jgi:hypothetical protein
MRCLKEHELQITDQALAALWKNRHGLTLYRCLFLIYIYSRDAKGSKKYGEAG